MFEIKRLYRQSFLSVSNLPNPSVTKCSYDPLLINPQAFTIIHYKRSSGFARFGSSCVKCCSKPSFRNHSCFVLKLFLGFFFSFEEKIPKFIVLKDMAAFIGWLYPVFFSGESVL